MKKLLTIALSITASIAAAQWTNVTNNFEDSMHMPVCTALTFQKNPLVLTSYPDGGYFVIWEDVRNSATTKTDIYAQKYDSSGNRLWAVDGIPVSAGANEQHYTFASNQDYRNRHFAATDSAGGFYICFTDDSVTNYVWERVMVQHVRSNGTTVFPGPGHIFFTSGSANHPVSPQLIADANKGFFIAYNQSLGNQYINVFCYRDEGGKMVYYGGGRVNENAIQTSDVAACGIRTAVEYPGTTVWDYGIWPDNEGGCNVIMNMDGNTASQHAMLAYNKVWRAKKDSRTQTFFRNTTGTACPRLTEYKKGEVYLLYEMKRDFQRVACGGSGGPLYTYTNYRLLSNGYLLIDNQGYDYNYPKGVTLVTDDSSNINVDLLATVRRSYENNVVSGFLTKGYAFPAEKFDSIPYQRASYNNPDFGYNPTRPLQLNTLNYFRDTLLGIADYFTDFSLAAGGNHIYATGLFGTTSNRLVRLQHLEVSRISPDSFAIEYKTNISGTPEKYGAAIGSEISASPSITYDVPHVEMTKSGKAFFYIREYNRGARVSPIESDAELAWGAMGKPISTGVYNGGFYRLEEPVVTLDRTGKTGLIAWRDNKFIPGNSYDNIFMRHLDKLDVFNYRPPVKKVKTLYYTNTEIIANPAVLYGRSRQYSTIELYNPNNNIGTTPVADILDVHYLGRVQFHAYQLSPLLPVRRYNNQAYLNRNYTIKTDSLPPGAIIDMLLYFTKEEFDALKNADNTIEDPGYLTVVRQNNTEATAPSVYTPVAGEELVPPVFWESTDGGYFIKVTTSGFGNFFFRKINTVSLCSASPTSFTSNVTGATYQWQVSTGAGINFVNIADNTIYSGVKTPVLQLTNIPSSFNGYRYRCVINNLNVSNSFYLQLTNTWTGAVSNLWETTGNWSCGTVPDGNTDVIINSGTVTINTSGAACRSIKVNPTANVSVAPGFKLTVTH